MATRKYNVKRGGIDKDVVDSVGSAVTAGKVVELTVDLAVGATKRDVLSAIDTIQRRIRKGIWPPA